MRPLLPGGWLNALAGSTQRSPGWRVLVWDPTEVTINELASGRELGHPRDLTPWILEASAVDNVGFESGDDPSVARMDFIFANDTPNSIRRGLFEDGCLVRFFVGDERVNADDWTCIFTGTFRGRPGEDAGTPAELTKGFVASALGREERFLNLTVTTRSFPQDTDVGTMAVSIAREHLNLGQDEVLFGAQGFPARHLTNQIVETFALDAIYQCLFPVGKKPRFDGLGRLVAVDVRLDKPAARIYPAGDYLIRSMRAQPNEVEVNNTVILKGLSHVMSKIVNETQRLVEYAVTTGWFEREHNENLYYSDDRSRRAEETYLVTVKRIRWADAEWEERDEFHGRLSIDTRWLANVQGILFGTFLATRIALAAIDYTIQQGGGVPGTALAIIRLALELASMASLVGFLWATSQIARGVYEIWGKPFEFVYQELIAKDTIDGLLPEEERVREFRNDFLTTMPDLKARAKELLRRELVKNQLFTIEVVDDPLLEVDDVIETSNGDRFYIATATRTYKRGDAPLLTLTCWKVDDAKTRVIDATEFAGAEV